MLIQKLLNQKEQLSKGTFDQNRSFFIHSSTLYSYSLNDSVTIYNQMQQATYLRTFEEWKQRGRPVRLGEKAIYLLENYSDSMTKHTALFDISQTEGRELADTILFSEEELKEMLELLSSDSLDSTELIDGMLEEYINAIATDGLKNYDKLTTNEKQVVPLISAYTIQKNLSIIGEEESLLTEIEEMFMEDPGLRFLPIMQVSNNMSTSIMTNFYSVHQLAKDQLAERAMKQAQRMKEKYAVELPEQQDETSEEIVSTEEEPINEKINPSMSVEIEELSLFDSYEETEGSDPSREETQPVLIPSTSITDFSFESKNGDPYSTGVVKKIEDNLEAVRLVKNLDNEKRQANPSEQEILSRYSGWGGVANELFDTRKDRFSTERRELRMLVTPDEYRSIEDSSLTSYYTDPKLIQSLWEKLEQAGFTGGKILDPAMGTGNFFSSMPESLKNKSTLVGVEIDSITGRIAAQLHPSANVQIRGFETTTFNENSFDLVVGNVPFTNLTLSDNTYQNMMIHDYFFKKSMDLVREGGVLAFITSTGTMDKADKRLRESLAKDANLIAGFRLPNNAFRTTANTDVTSDLLFFQKKSKQKLLQIEEPPLWINGAESDTTPNPYFIENSDHVLGELFIKNFNGQTLSVKPTENYLTLFAKQSLPLSYQPTLDVLPDTNLNTSNEVAVQETSMEDLEPFTFGVHEGKIYYNTNTGIEEVPPRNKKSVKRIEGMIALREELRELIRIQKTENYDVQLFNQQLIKVNNLYDRFVQTYGAFHHQENKLVFRDDDYYPLLCSTELEIEDASGKVQYEKSEVFFHATIRPQRTVTHATTAVEAMQLSINNKREIDFEYMKELYGKETDEMIQELGNEIFLNPETTNYESSSEYLSGDVKTKLAIVNEEIEQGNSLYETNQAALLKVIPPDLQLPDISFHIGTTWVPEQYYVDFLTEKLKISDYYLENVFALEKNPSNKEYFISNKTMFRSPLATKTYGTEERNAYQLFEDLLNFKNTTVMMTVEVDDGLGGIKEKSIMNPEATLLCREKQELLRTEFKQWVEQSSIRRTELETIYNERFNRSVVRVYDGQSLTFGTMNASIELRPHQKNAVQRIVTEGRGLLAHVVGSGKTLSMIASGMKLKELGLVKKPLYLVPKSLIRPFGEEILRAYPDKKVLIATDQDFKKENRKQFISKVATGTYDAIVMGHTQFAKTPLSKERYEAFLWNELDSLEELLMDCEEGTHSFKAIKGELKQAEKRLTKQLNAMDRDRILDFEDLGVDFIFVDEAHMFKNLGVRSKLGNVAGISTASANKSLDMLAKIQYIQEENNGRGVVFATGTPISNSMCELYTMNRYLAPDILEEMGVTHFDDWQGVFGEVENKLEMTPEASGYRSRARFSKFHNVPELMTQFSRFTDIQTADMLSLPTPTLHKVIVDTKATPMQEMKMEELAERSEAIRSGSVSPSEDNMLKITSEARRMALDPRLLSENVYGRNDSNKLQECVNNVFKLWNESHETKATQIIFSDIGTPSSKKFNVYDELKTLLVEKGIPENEIQFIHDATNDIKKEKLFKEVRTGSVRVLLGSTEKLGTGVNVQNRLLAIHNLDCPWRPSDLEQRVGRIERQGNQFKDVYSYTYITKGTFDSYLFQIQEQKLTYITQIMSSKAISRSTDDVDELVVQASEVKALATGNPLLKQRADLENDVRRLRLLKSNHYQQAKAMNQELEQAKRLIPAYEKRINDIQEDLKIYKSTVENNETSQLIIGDKVYTSEDKTSEVGQLLLTDIETLRITSSDLKKLRQQTIATYNGFSVHFSGIVANSSDYILKVQGKADYSLQIKGDSPLSLMTKLSNLENEIEKSYKRTNDLLSQEQENLSELITQQERPFDRSDELAEKEQLLKIVDEVIELGLTIDEALDLGIKLEGFLPGEKEEVIQDEIELEI